MKVSKREESEVSFRFLFDASKQELVGYRTDLGSRDGEREVDELESESDLPVLVRDRMLLLVGEVLSAEDSEGGLHVEVANREHVTEGREEGRERVN